MKQRQIHLDFHTSRLITDVGAQFSKIDFETMLKQTQADQITCFAKCHHGNLYYETKLPEMHPHLAKNLLTEQYEVTQKLGIPMPIYISVGFDEYQAQEHPEWLAIDEKGRRIKEFGEHPFDAGWHWLCLNNRYPETIMAVITDIFSTYEVVAGFFFDIVTQPNCCCNNCIASMHDQNLNPYDENDRYIFARQVEDNFKKRISQLIHDRNPTATIFYNGLVWNQWPDQGLTAYTHLEIESLASGIWGYDHYPLVAKMMRHTGLETVAMTGRFHKSWADFGGYKTIEAITFETIRGALLSNAVSIGDQLHPSGIMDWQAVSLIQQGFKAAETYFHDGSWSPLYDIAILVDPKSNDLFSSASAGAVRLLRENHFLYDLIDKRGDFRPYKLLILADTLSLNSDDVIKLQTYCTQGGKILASYESGLGSLFDVVQEEASIYENDYVVIAGTHYIAYQSGKRLKLSSEFVTDYPIYDPYFNRSYRHFSSHFQAPYHNPSGFDDCFRSQNMTYLAHPYFSLYYENGNQIYSDLIVEEIDRMIKPTLKIQAPKSIYVEVQQHQDSYVVSLLNYIPVQKGEVFTIDTALECSDVTLIYHDQVVKVPPFKGHMRLKLVK